VLKVRLIPSLLLLNGRCVKGVRFADFRDVGHPVTAARVYDAQGADELLFLDITASVENRSTLFEVVARTAEECFMPLTAGGGVRSLGDIRTLLRCGADPTSYVASVREIVRKLDSGVALRGVGTLQKEVTDSIGIIRIMGILMGVFGMVALALSSVGVYGVLSESVAQRTHEIGIRVALGANPRDLMRLVLAHALKLTLIGLAIAVPVAFVLSRLLAGVIHGVVTLDLAILADLSLLLVLVALVAAFLPARRAMRVDPMVALRCE